MSNLIIIVQLTKQTEKLVNLPRGYDLVTRAWDPLFQRWYTNIQHLVFRQKYFSMFIQTDKPLYKGGDLVNFRIFSINSETLPANVNGAIVTIFEVGNIKIKSFNANFVKGKYENSLQLSQSPTLGEWKIEVKIENEVS